MLDIEGLNIPNPNAVSTYFKLGRGYIYKYVYYPKSGKIMLSRISPKDCDILKIHMYESDNQLCRDLFRINRVLHESEGCVKKSCNYCRKRLKQ